MYMVALLRAEKMNELTVMEQSEEMFCKARVCVFLFFLSRTVFFHFGIVSVLHGYCSCNSLCHVFVI